MTAIEWTVTPICICDFGMKRDLLVASGQGSAAGVSLGGCMPTLRASIIYQDEDKHACLVPVRDLNVSFVKLPLLHTQCFYSSIHKPCRPHTERLWYLDTACGGGGGQGLPATSVITGVLCVEKVQGVVGQRWAVIYCCRSRRQEHA